MSLKVIRTICSVWMCCAAAFLAHAVGAEPRLARLEPARDVPVLALKSQLDALGARVLSLTPEGAWLVEWPDEIDPGAASLEGVASIRLLESRQLSSQTAANAKEISGWRRSKEKDRKSLEDVCTRVTHIEPNDLARDRAALEGRTDRPSQADNSLSNAFPRIGNQGAQGSCTTWAACYYWNSYTHALDEDLDLYAPGSYDHISSPAFLFNLFSGGNEEGSDILDIVAGMRDLGCSSWNQMPYDPYDLTTWPTESAWIEALKRRTGPCKVIGTEAGCSDADMEAIKQYLANGRIAIVGLAVYGSWSGWRGEDSSAFNNGVLYANSGSFVGGHGLALVGYDDNRTYVDGGVTRQGAFLLANAWGYRWGLSKPISAEGWNSGGFLWVGYEYFKTANAGHDDLLGMAFFNEDRGEYRPRLVAVAGLNHAHRGEVALRAGSGTTSNPAWISHQPFRAAYRPNLPITDERRVAIDCTDGLPASGDLSLFAELNTDSLSTSEGNMTSAKFLCDLQGTGVFETVASTDPVVTVSPGGTGYATVQIARTNLAVLPGAGFDDAVWETRAKTFLAAGPHGGPFLSETTFTIKNSGDAPLAWSTDTTASWIGLSQETGTLAPGEQSAIVASVLPEASDYAPGHYAGVLSLLDNTSNGRCERYVELKVRPPHTIQFDVTPAEGPAHLSRNVQLSARDYENALVTAFDSSVALRALEETEPSQFGRQDFYFDPPMMAYYRNSRTQVIYLAQDVGPPGWLTHLALNINYTTGVTLKHWTIRIKHTSLNEFPERAWNESGWTTLYRSDATIERTGWHTFQFDKPFAYNGTDNLMIDFSISGLTEIGGRVWTYWTSTERIRNLRFGTYRPEDDPLTWAGDYPQPYQSRSVPDIVFGRGTEIPITPTQSDAFGGGVWNGSLLLPETEGALRLYAVNGDGPGGVSPPLLARYGTDGDGDGMTYEQETRDFDPGLPGIQNPFDYLVADATGDNGQDTPDGIPDGRNDWDGDGMPNVDEFAWNHDPTDPTDFSMLPLNPIAPFLALLLAVLATSRIRERKSGRSAASGRTCK